ncbi:MAG TPA: response regulator [Hypericibacter adhaerens]|uniref:response regulator n=1 Tax=Hypericibacter adhaerens TaxID=2602016 RepID=UPI002B8FB668|nr:response regulator [Hypericibacter adhaerens]HWA46114.1 response regulator [Hypericibacter adhaerens]
MAVPLQVLIVEDSGDDVDLLLLEIARAGFKADHEVVETADGLKAALDRRAWDIILADFSLPKFSGTEALKIVRGRGLDTPFIFVSGSIGEDTAVMAMKAGAQDYLIKGNLRRLGPAIERELRDSELRRARAEERAERHRAEERLRKLSRAVEQSANLVAITDADGIIEYVNPKLLEITGFAAEELIGKTPAMWKPAGPAGAECAVAWSGAADRSDLQGEFEMLRKDGRRFSVYATISPIRDESGAVTHLVGIAEDISRRKEIEEQLRRSQRLEAIGQLTGGLAHDFNNLLAVVIGNLDILCEQLPKDAPGRKMAQQALEAGLRGADLTRQLLAFARRQPLETRVVNLNDLITGTTRLLQRTLGEPIEIEMKLADDLWPALTDASLVEAALVNLAINARDAMPSGGRLTIESMNKRLDERYAAENSDVTPGDYAMIAVSDTGSGIAPENLSRVFEPFFTTKPQGRGTGLGLSMVYGFVKQSKGHVKIYSELGHGTTIRLYLPRVMTGPSPTVESAQREGNGDLKGVRVLLVEDHPGVREVAVKQLEEFGCRVLQAHDGHAALALLKEGQPVDLLFTDIVMPGGMTGVELARHATELRPGLRILFTSGFAENALQGDQDRLGDRNFLSKPYRKQDLMRRIREVLANPESR